MGVEVTEGSDALAAAALGLEVAVLDSPGDPTFVAGEVVASGIPPLAMAVVLTFAVVDCCCQTPPGGCAGVLRLRYAPSGVYRGSF